MKANFPVEYMASVLTYERGDVERIAIYVAECKRMGIEVLPPDVNESGADFTVVALPNEVTEGASASDGERPEQFSSKKIAYPEGTSSAGRIRFGLSSIKNFGEGVAKSIIEERERGGAYKGLADFLTRVGTKNLNRKSLESLIKCGALDSLGERGTLLGGIETLLAFHKDASASAPQDSLFGALAAPTLTLSPGAPVSLVEKLNWEKELLGIYVSGHPLDAHEATLAKSRVSLGSIKQDPQLGLPVILPLLVAEVRTILTKSGEKMAFIKFEDRAGESMEAVAFPKLYKEHAASIASGTCLLIKGNVSNRNGELSLALENLKPL
jgi:DNA polymerase-3 subunit alpha